MSKLEKFYDPKRIEKQNKAFHKLSNRKKRLAIAEDVLLQLKAEKYLASPGEYVYVRNTELIDEDSGELKDLQKVLLTESPECSVCGLGAAFVSLARLGDRVSIDDGDVGIIQDTLSTIFGYDQVNLIEYAFEGEMFTDDEVSEEKAEACEKFHDKYDDDDKRLRAIFSNIIKNDGTFKP